MSRTVLGDSVIIITIITSTIIPGTKTTHRYGREVVGGVVLDALGVVDERREDDDADDKEEDEQHQLVSGRLERVDKDLEAGRVPGELEQPHDADDAEELEDVVLLQQHQQQQIDQLFDPPISRGAA